MFAARDIPKGRRILEYRGVRISYDCAAELYPDFEDEPTHTFLFEIDDDIVIDAAQRGNAARWINHSCAPNCEAVEDEGGGSTSRRSATSAPGRSSATTQHHPREGRTAAERALGLPVRRAEVPRHAASEKR